MKLNHLTNDTLLSETLRLVKKEKGITIIILHHLMAIDERRLYASLNYQSLFYYCVKELGYSEQESYLRLGAMRLLRKSKLVEEKLVQGELTLTQLGLLSQFAKTKEGPLQIEKVDEVLEIIGGKSARETKIILDERSGRKKELTVTIKVSIEVYQIFEQLKKEWGHGTDGDIFKDLCKEKLKELEIRREKENRIDKKSTIEVEVKVKNPGSRHIPVKLKRRLFQNSGHCCEFISPQNGKRCEQSKELQVHHAFPFSAGGLTEEGNLKIYCKIHNTTAGHDYFGDQKMNRFRNFT